MNWTGGSFARHSRKDTSLTARQKQHFAKVRSILQSRSKTPSPLKRSFTKETVLRSWHSSASRQRESTCVATKEPFRVGDEDGDEEDAHALADDSEAFWNGRNLQTSALAEQARTSARPNARSTRKRLFADGMLDVIQSAAAKVGPDPEDDGGILEDGRCDRAGLRQSDAGALDVSVTPADTDLELQRRRLLSKQDWAGIKVVQPLRMKYPAPADRHGRAKRRKLTGSGKCHPSSAAAAAAAAARPLPRSWLCSSPSHEDEHKDDHARPDPELLPYDNVEATGLAPGGYDSGVPRLAGPNAGLHRLDSLLSESTIANLVEAEQVQKPGCDQHRADSNAASKAAYRQRSHLALSPREGSELSNDPALETPRREEIGAPSLRDFSSFRGAESSSKLSHSSSHNLRNHARSHQEGEHDRRLPQSVRATSDDESRSNVFSDDNNRPPIEEEDDDDDNVLHEEMPSKPPSRWDMPATPVSGPPTPIGSDDAIFFPRHVQGAYASPTAEPAAPRSAPQKHTGIPRSTAATVGEPIDGPAGMPGAKDEALWKQWLSIDSSSKATRDLSLTQTGGVTTAMTPTDARSDLEFQLGPGVSSANPQQVPSTGLQTETASDRSVDNGNILKSRVLVPLYMPRTIADPRANTAAASDDCWKKFVFGDEDDNDADESSQIYHSCARPFSSKHARDVPSLCKEPSQLSSVGLLPTISPTAAAGAKSSPDRDRISSGSRSRSYRYSHQGVSSNAATSIFVQATSQGPERAKVIFTRPTPFGVESSHSSPSAPWPPPRSRRPFRKGRCRTLGEDIPSDSVESIVDNE